MDVCHIHGSGIGFDIGALAIRPGLEECIQVPGTFGQQSTTLPMLPLPLPWPSTRSPVCLPLVAVQDIHPMEPLHLSCVQSTYVHGLDTPTAVATIRNYST